MAKVEVIDIQENSLDSSADDSELLGMVDEGSFESAECRESQTYLDPNEEENATTYFKDLSAGGVTYRFVPMTSGEDTVANQTGTTTHVLPPGQAEFYVLSNPVDMFSTTAAAPKKSTRKEQLQSKAITTKKRDDKRRATHNEVERRRRDKINSWITKLALLIPNPGLPDSVSKGGILAKACDHIVDLTEKHKKFEKLEKDNERLLTEILRLNKELSELRKENITLRDQQSAEGTCLILHHAKNQKS